VKVQRPDTEPKSPKPKPPTTAEDDEDVEGHFMNLPSSVAMDLARAREHDIKKGAARHPLIAEARERSRRKR
jgi:hypothetical protein